MLSPRPTNRWVALGVITVGVALIIMDATIVNVAVPTVIRSLSLTTADAEWLGSAYALTFGAFLLTFGRLGDRVGRRPMFLWGMTLFALASVVVGSATTSEMLIGARLVQGMGAAMIMPAGLSTVNALFTGKERGIAFAVWGSTIGGMAAVGPLVGGWLTTDYSWRWAFWLNIPIALAVIAVGLRRLPETAEGEHDGLDLVGMLLAATGMGALVFALIESQRYGWWHRADGSASPIPWVLLLSVVLLTAFVLLEVRRLRAGRAVMLDVGLLDHASYRWGSIAALIVAFGEFGLLFTLPLLLQGALGYSALDTGWVILVLAVGTFLASGVTPQLTRRRGGRSVVRIGLGVEAVAVGALAVTLGLHQHWWVIAAWLFLYGLGVGMATAQLTSVVLVDIPVVMSGQASGLLSTFRQIGSALGVAVLGALLVAGLSSGTASRLDALGMPPEAAHQAVVAVRESDGAVIPQLAADPRTAPVAHAAAESLVASSRVVTAAASLLLLLGLLVTLALPDAGRGADGDEQEEENVPAEGGVGPQPEPTPGPV